MNNKKAEHHEYLLSDLVNFKWFQSELIFLFYICIDERTYQLQNV